LNIISGEENGSFDRRRKVERAKPIFGIPIIFSILVNDSQVTVRFRLNVGYSAINLE